MRSLFFFETKCSSCVGDVFTHRDNTGQGDLLADY